MGFNEDKLAEGYRQQSVAGIDLQMQLDDLRRHLKQCGWTFTVWPGKHGGWQIEVVDETEYMPMAETAEHPTILAAIVDFQKSDACPPNRENM